MFMHNTPDLIKLYIKSCAIGFALAVVFVGLLIGFDVMGLRGLVMRSEDGILALVMIWFFNGIVFSGVQFAFAIMAMADDDDDDDDRRGGHRHDDQRARVYLAEPIPVRPDPKRRR